MSNPYSAKKSAEAQVPPEESDKEELEHLKKYIVELALSYEESQRDLESILDTVMDTFRCGTKNRNNIRRTIEKVLKENGVKYEKWHSFCGVHGQQSPDSDWNDIEFWKNVFLSHTIPTPNELVNTPNSQHTSKKSKEQTKKKYSDVSILWYIGYLVTYILRQTHLNRKP